jgi:hypothetical protein
LGFGLGLQNDIAKPPRSAVVNKFLAFVLSLCLLAGSAVAAPPSGSDSLLPAKKEWVALIADAMTLPGMKVSLSYRDCGQVNAYYWYATKTVVICNELLDEPIGFVRFVMAHEMAHAVIMQKDIPYTGSHEDAADQLAAVFLYVNDMREDIYEAAEWFYQWRDAEPSPLDDHTWPHQRAWQLFCYYVGTEETGSECNHRFGQALKAWDRLLKF